jgi:hypothetical protein
MTNLIIISGVSRSGKTELTKKLLNIRSSNFISVDAIVNGLFLTQEFIEYDKKHKDKDKNYLYLEPILVEIIRVSSVVASTIIVETELLVPWNYKKFEKLFDPKKFKLHYYCLGQAKISSEQKLKLYQKKPELLGWMKDYDQKELKKVVTNHCILNQKVKQSCVELGYEFYDTSFGYQKNLNLIKKTIKSNLIIS